MNKYLVLLVGPPGSGKSTYAKKLEQEGYTRISQDDQGADHITYLDVAMMDGQNIVVDRMNFNREQRKRYTSRARDNNYIIKFIVFHESYDTCVARMVKREDHPTIKDEATARMALQTFFTKYERPSYEGDDVNQIEFLYPEGTKPFAVICDLDGTLCDIRHRLHYVRREGKKDWKSFFMELDNDCLNYPVFETIKALEKLYPVVFASGRPNDYRRKTSSWLQKFGFKTNELYMRHAGDHRPDYVAKEIILDFEILTRYQPFLFLDDRNQVVELWRRRGYPCFQVQNGDF